MPKRKAKHGGRGRKHAELADKALARRERRAGLYVSPGDPDFKSLSEQLEVHGLALRDVPGDGNCLFRALSEQLHDHFSNIRQSVVDHIRANSADFAPFVEEDVTFESHVDELSRDGTYAGNDAIVAVSRCYQVNIVIHQVGSPPWEVSEPSSQKTVHIAYLRGEHYCSVMPHDQSSRRHPHQETRAARQDRVGSGLPPARQDHVGSGATAKPKSSSADRWKRCVQKLMEATGCQDTAQAEQCLKENGGEVELAIVELLQLLSLSEDSRFDGADAAGKVQVDSQQLSSSTVNSTAGPHASKIPHTSKEMHSLSKRERKAVRKLRRNQQEKSSDTSQDPVEAMLI